MTRSSWNWPGFTGDPVALKWARQDLRCLDAIVGHVPAPRRVAVQAGGNLGVFPRRLAELFDVVYTFEPSLKLFHHMVANAPQQNIVRLQAALGDHHRLVGTSTVRRDGKTAKPHAGLTHIAGDGVVPTLRLDDLELPVCDLLCLDLEGYELFALRGALETIARCRPVISIEINRNAAQYGVTEAELYGFLGDRGYTEVDRQNSDVVFVRAH